MAKRQRSIKGVHSPTNKLSQNMGGDPSRNHQHGPRSKRRPSSFHVPIIVDCTSTDSSESNPVDARNSAEKRATAKDNVIVINDDDDDDDDDNDSFNNEVAAVEDEDGDLVF